jgi:hypothetical protein
MSENSLAGLVRRKAEGVTRLEARVEVVGSESEERVVLSFLVSDLQKSQPGKERDSVGFAMIPSSLVLEDGSMLMISSPWVQITAR